MIICGLEISLDVGTIPDGVLDSLLKKFVEDLSSMFPNMGAKLADRSEFGSARRTGDDGAVIRWSGIRMPGFPHFWQWSVTLTVILSSVIGSLRFWPKRHEGVAFASSLSIDG